jgi:hypothetical protein
MAAVVSSGLALSAGAQVDEAERFAASSATKIEALRVDGSIVLGRTISLGGSSGPRFTTAFDQLSGIDQCGFGDLYPQSGVMQSAVEDVVLHPGTEAGLISSFSVAATRPLCDGGAGTTSEEFLLVVLSWEVIDNVADLDGTDGFAAPPLGLVTPMELVDSDGDTFIDGFNGGILLNFADTDTDGDGANDQLLSSGASGYGLYFGTGLETLGVPMPSGVDRYDGSGGAPDGRPDGGIQVIMSRGFGDDGQGPLFAGLYPATNSRLLFGATAEDDVTGCLAQNYLGQGSSNGTLWAEGMSDCGGGAGWSEGSASPSADELYDPLVDIRDLEGVLSPPNPNSFGIAMKICTVPDDTNNQNCCDVNQDGACTASDFPGWLYSFNNGLPTCDVNQDGACTAADFTAWISAYSDSHAGTPQLCTF